MLIFDDENPHHLCEFVGWHHSDTASLEFVKTGFLRDTVLTCVDLVGKLDALPGQAQIVENRTTYKIIVTTPASVSATMVFTEPLPVALPSGSVLFINGSTPITLTVDANRGATGINVAAISTAISTSDRLHYTAAPQNWMQMHQPSSYKFIDYLLRWHSTALEIADWSWPTFEYNLAFVTRASDAASLYAQVAEQARCLEVDHYVCCNRYGQLQMRVDPMLQSAFHRTATVQAALSGHIRAIRVAHESQPRYQWIRGAGVIEGWTPLATTVQVEYAIRPAADFFGDIGATTIETYPLPVALPSGATLYLRGLGDVLIEYATTTATASQGATSISVAPLEDTVSEWDRLVYRASAPGPDRIPTVFCIAPGTVYGQGLQTLTVGNKLVQNQGGLNSTIGNLYERLNAEYTQIDIDLVGVKSLGVIDPTDLSWVTVSAFDSDYIPQRLLPFFANGARLLPIELSRNIEETQAGVLEWWTLRAERETVGLPAVTIGGDE